MIIPLLGPTNLGGAIALTYHDVIDRRSPGSVWFDCTTSEFRAQMQWLKGKGANFISAGDLERAYQGSPLPKDAVLITFADNYRGFYRNALPILKAMGIPAVMFVHTGFVGSPVGRPKGSWEDLRAARATGFVTVASQTVTHPADLTRLSDADLNEELTASRKAIDARFGECRYLAYPNGKFDARVARAARSAGYSLAFTEVLAPLSAGPDRWRLPRWVHTRYRDAWRARMKPGPLATD